MQVLKFGGTSVANAINIKKVKDIILESGQEKTVIVVSALGGTTDILLQCGLLAAAGDPGFGELLQQLAERHLTAVRELLPVDRQSGMLSYVRQQFNELEEIFDGILILNEFSDRIKDKVLSYGELISSRIIAAFLAMEGLSNKWIDARTIIRTDNLYTRANVLVDLTYECINLEIGDAPDMLFILPGFIASDRNGITTTLGRGGSDYTAALIGAALKANKVEIWTDVTGMMTADPRMVSNARRIDLISYKEAMELSHFGARVIYPPTIQPLLARQIPIAIRNTFAPEEKGTLMQEMVVRDGDIITGISSINKIVLLNLEGGGMIGIPGFSKRLFETLAIHQVNVILITQASSEHSICVGIEEQYTAAAKAAVDQAFSFEIEKGIVNPVRIEKDLSIVALVGDKMKSHSGTSGRMFSALGSNGINIRAIAQGSSERNISAVISTADIKKAVNVLHETFFETAYKQINLFIAGTGNVGGKLISQIIQQQAYLLQQLRIQLRLVGLINSRTMILDEEGIDPGNWQQRMKEGATADLPAFISRLTGLNLRNSIFVDVTATENVAATYRQLLAKSIAVVACNKIACSATYHHYQDLKEQARDHNVAFLYETNVGAGLPVIGTINDLLRSGDQIHKIEAVLSGTLNFVFNQYDGSRSFASVVKQAQEEGYTEPDPRLDLGGTDVMRKIMILAREAGAQLEMIDIKNEGFMPEACMQGSVAHFYEEMEHRENYFKQLYNQAAANGNKLKFVARFENGQAAVGLKEIEPAHDFYHLYGKDNIVLFYTDRYKEQPMVIKGAGAGAAVTASGVFADIIRTVKS